MNRLIFFLLLMAFSCQQEPTALYLSPTGTVVKGDMEDDPGKGEQRRAWIEDLHRAAPDVDWRHQEYLNDMARHERRKQGRDQFAVRSGEETFANGQLTGQWRERGSSNQAGSVIATEYHPEEDKIYTISAGGSLFKASLHGLDWEVVNHDLRFSGSLLKFIEHEGEERLVAIIDRVPHYSIDGGYSWTRSEGIPINDRWGNCYSPQVYENEIYVLSKPSYWTALKIYKSHDGGETYEVIQELSSHDQGRYSLFQLHSDEALRLVEKSNEDQSTISVLDSLHESFELAFQLEDPHGFKDGRANMTGFKNDSSLTYVFYTGEEKVYRSDDGGITWTEKDQLDKGPWGVGIYILPSDPDIMLMGEVECYRSGNGGTSWQRVNRWGEYYGDVVNKLHADMMYFNEFVDNDGNPFLLISNHGGLSISRDGGIRNTNIGLYGLNVSQYYSVRTDPLDPEVIYAGTQDQGFQRGRKNNADWVDFDQIISGDYGHICFSNNGSSMWSVYPGGWIIYYGSPYTQRYPELTYEIKSDHESVWIPPLVPHPDPSTNTIFAAGGNIEGGEGSYVIRLDVDQNGISASQLPTDFRSLSSNGKIGAIAFSNFDANHMYVSSDNGRFFYSQDAGQSFKQGRLNVPGSHYLYGTSILPSKLDPETIYVGGSGYSNSPVVISEDGGVIFKDFSNGLPPTVVFQLASNEDESLIFAATESGPFAYVASEDQWFDISGQYAPAQTYWSVEFLPEENVARFGTYGRGIWDFEVSEIITSITDQDKKAEYIAYPQPSIDVVYLNTGDEKQYRLYDLQGKELLEGVVSSSQGIDVSQLKAGSYVLQLEDQAIQIIKI